MKLNYKGYERYLVMKGSINSREKYGFVFDNGYGACVLEAHVLYGNNLYEFAVCIRDKHNNDTYIPTRIANTEFCDGTLLIHGEKVKEWLEKVKRLT